MTGQRSPPPSILGKQLMRPLSLSLRHSERKLDAVWRAVGPDRVLPKDPQEPPSAKGGMIPRRTNAKVRRPIVPDSSAFCRWRVCHSPHIRVDNSHARRRDVVEALPLDSGDLVPVRGVAEPLEAVVRVRFETLDLSANVAGDAARPLEARRSVRGVNIDVADLGDSRVLVFQLCREARMAGIQVTILAISDVPSSIFGDIRTFTMYVAVLILSSPNRSRKSIHHPERAS